MSITRWLLLIAALAGVSACASTGPLARTPIRASSLDRLGNAASEVHLARSVKETIPELERIFVARGFPLLAEYDAPENTRFLLFKGRPRDVSVVAGSVDVVEGTGVGWVDSATFQLGSWFAARVRRELGGTTVWLLGKPTLQNVEPCSDADRELGAVKYWCVDAKGSNMGPLLPYLNGAAEADVVQGVLTELRQADVRD